MTTTTAVSPPAAPSRAGREAYRDLLARLIVQDDRLVCLDSDTGLFDGVDFGSAAARYVNLGIAEQNLMGVAAGLAKCGYLPFVNTMAAFASSRAVEALKIDIAMNNLPVRVVATHGGLSAGHLGSTHHCLEDLAATRLLPNMTVLVPADAPGTEELLRQSLDLPGPVYVRLGRQATAELPPGSPALRLGQAQILRRGPDIALVACGPHPVLFALEAADELARDGIGATVVNLHTIKPLDADALRDVARTTRGIVTVEEHWQAGGLGSAVAELLAETGSPPILRVAVADVFVSGSGSHQDLLARADISCAAVVAKARRILGGVEPGRQRVPGTQRR